MYLLELWPLKMPTLECRKIFGPLNISSALVDIWISHTTNVETFDYSSEVWVGESISNGEPLSGNDL